jgi:SNF2 family DNA or RNA helicase
MISILTDRSSLFVHLKLQNINLNLLRKITLLISSQSDSADIKQEEITLPWIDFKQVLFDFSNLCKSHEENVDFDDFSKFLVEKYLEDRNYRRNNLKLLTITPSDFQKILEDSGFNRKLTVEQVRDVQKLLNLRHGANFSVPGAGKTTVLLATFIVLKHYLIVSNLFVISPKNAFLSWEDEVNDIFLGTYSTYRLNDLTFQTIKEASKPNYIVLINYEKLRKDIKILFPYFLENNVHLVLDESHRIKSGENNLSYSQIDNLACISVRRDILSGTPLPQRYLDLKPQLYFLWRDDLIPYEILDSKEDVSESINQSIKDYFVRTTKDELGLKKPKFNYLSIEMGPIQTEIYNLLRSEVARKLSGLSRDQVSYLRALGSMTVRLMQAATTPMLLGNEDEYFNELLDISSRSPLWEAIFDYSKYEKPAKFVFLETFIQNYLNKDANNKIVLWTYFIKNIKLLEKILQKYNPTSIYGAINTGSIEDFDSRESRIRKFHIDPDCRLLIANPQACGEGISLHKACHHAIYLDRNFNAAYYLQSVDRIHRLGLGKDIDTQITILIAKDTIDEIIVKRLNEKTVRMAEVLNDQFLRKLAFDPEDIEIDEALGLDSQDVQDVIHHIGI